MTTSTVRCPFCFSEKVAAAPVCPTCNRETEIPVSLRKELEDLILIRDRLRDELAEKEARLFMGRRRPTGGPDAADA
jgi:hypothetical protein